ncbi:MAG: lipopolysaccharide transport periplasmic protein LptA [bacterium]|nr:lipopolysaccharide transport periplasmic protein LptA [bacterium]
MSVLLVTAENRIVARVMAPLVVLWATMLFVAVPGVYGNEPLPITITANRMEGDFKSGIITFLDAVKVVRGEMVLYADHVELHPGEQGKKIEKVTAAGHVRVVDGSRSASSDRAEYVDAGEILILTGNAKVSDGQNTITGPLIRIYLREERTEVEGTRDERPRFLFYPDKLKEEAQGGGK